MKSFGPIATGPTIGRPRLFGHDLIYRYAFMHNSLFLPRRHAPLLGSECKGGGHGAEPFSLRASRVNVSRDRRAFDGTLQRLLETSANYFLAPLPEKGGEL